ncbi:hypothetical protein NA57DRAFT_65680 [Rhizodiscina lignyota]|uniref:DUF6594 domain-containing protein n=1 Tax=Rhizodiscina lignyota TaxID=1504668 RepID=A0A9P4M797_9PEZI|nr:hypothetical protein NA57DRAFT_65680 [Rhizodiscina lignyota]
MTEIQLENGIKDRLVTGYPKLGQRMGLNPELAIFRKFSSLGAQIVLYTQCELVYLEKQLREVELANSKSDDPARSRYSVNAKFFMVPNEEGDEQKRLIGEIIPKLKEYWEILRLQQGVANMPEPSKYEVDHIQNYMASYDMGPYAMRGEDAHVWGSIEPPREQAPDLVALQGRSNVDPFSRWVTGTGLAVFFACGFHRFRRPSANSGLVGYSEEKLLRLTYWITTIVASVLPIVPLIILNIVQSLHSRLAIVAAFNILLSLCLLVFTEAKRSEIFAVTAASVTVVLCFELSARHS